MQITAISVSLGKPFDVSTDFCQQYQFHSESITNNEKVELEKRVGPNAETGRSFQSQELGDSRGKRIRKRVRIYGLSTSSSTLNPIATNQLESVICFCRWYQVWKKSCERWSLNSTTPRRSS